MRPADLAHTDVGTPESTKALTSGGVLCATVIPQGKPPVGSSLRGQLVAVHVKQDWQAADDSSPYYSAEQVLGNLGPGPW